MSDHGALQVHTIVNGPFQENCFVAADSDAGEAIVVDPGWDADALAERIRALEVTVATIVCTHAHIDHAGAVAPLKRLLGVPFAMHPGDAPVLANMNMSAQMFGLPEVETPEVERDLAEGDEVKVGGLTAQVLHTPGHSPGGSCLHFADQQVVIVGDTLFAGSVGRTDLPGGSTQLLLDSIKDKLLGLPDETTVYCGHGPSTTIGAERKANPFLQAGGNALF